MAAGGRGRAALLIVVLAAAACSGDDGGAAPDDAPTDGAEPTSTLAGPTSTERQPVGDGSAFCDAMIAIGEVAPESEDPADVLAANVELADAVGEAVANLPEESPAEVAALLDDYQAAVDAIDAAAGDVEAAYDRLPDDVVARLGSADAHPEGYAFVVERCGGAAGR